MDGTRSSTIAPAVRVAILPYRRGPAARARELAQAGRACGLHRRPAPAPHSPPAPCPVRATARAAAPRSPVRPEPTTAPPIRASEADSLPPPPIRASEVGLTAAPDDSRTHHQPRTRNDGAKCRSETAVGKSNALGVRLPNIRLKLESSASPGSRQPKPTCRTFAPAPDPRVRPGADVARTVMTVAGTPRPSSKGPRESRYSLKSDVLSGVGITW